MGDKTSDVRYSQNSIFLADNGDVVLLYNNNDAIVDEINFNEIETGKSWERKAFSNNQCVSSQNDGEFLGNGCDTDSVTDFEIRNTPKPQNSSSLPEPREVQTALSVNSWDITYNPNTLSVNFNWPENTDLTYNIQEYNSPGVVIFEGNNSSFAKRINEVGKKYKFSIQAFDKEGKGSNLVEKEIDVPSFVKDVGFYNSLHYTRDGEKQDNLVEFSYNNYPFLPLDLVYASYSGPNYKTLVFYLNTAAPKRIYLNGDLPLAEDIGSVLQVKYDICAGGNSNRKSLLLPDTEEKCNIGGEFRYSSIRYSSYLAEVDKHLLLSTDGSVNGQSTFTGSDYITVAFYGFRTYFPQGYSPPNGILENFELLAVDNTKYYFQNTALIHSSPTTPSNLEVLSYTVSSPTSAVKLSWDSSVDSDTIDSIIRYEWSSDGVLWQPLSLDGRISDKLSSNISLELGGTYDVSIRAVDDFGNLSGVARTTIILPSPPPINLIPDSSNDYFAIDDVKLIGNIINVKWRLIKNPTSNSTFGIIPFDPLIGVSSNNLSNLRALNRDYDSNSSYPYLTANSSNQCSSGVAHISQYVLGWQYQTNFSSISVTPAVELLGKEINFGLYVGAPCNPADNENNPIFSGYPSVVKN